MTKVDVVNNIKFRQRCDEYGLNCNDCEVYDDVILLNTPTKGLYVLFDKNYNTIGVVNWRCSTNIKQMHLKAFYSKYSKFSYVMPFGYGISYPFQGFTLKNIIDLSNKIQIIATNLGQPLCTIVNDKSYDRSSQENEEYFQLLSYIKFLGEEIKRYFLFSYHMQFLGYEFPDVYSYMKSIIEKINDSIDRYIEKNERISSIDIFSHIGQNYRELNMNGILYDVVSLLMKDKGYQIKSGFPYEFEKMTLTEEKKDLSLDAQKLLEILSIKEEGGAVLVKKKIPPKKPNNN